MKKILISLKESAYNDFIRKNKQFEYRKRWPNDKVTAYVYVKGKLKSILLKIDFDYPIYKKSEEIAKIAASEQKEWYESILNYFKNNEYAFAIKALKISIINNPRNLEEMKDNNIFPPQNYTFIDKNIEKWVEGDV